MSTLAVLVIVALCSAPVLLAQEDITDICDYPCTQEIFNEQCGGAVCPLPKSPSQDELDAICSLNCLSALEFGNVSGCIADVDVWRPDIDGDARGMAADIRIFCTENGMEIEALPSLGAPPPSLGAPPPSMGAPLNEEEAHPSQGLDEDDIDDIVEADLIDG